LLPPQLRRSRDQPAGEQEQIKAVASPRNHLYRTAKRIRNGRRCGLFAVCALRQLHHHRDLSLTSRRRAAEIMPADCGHWPRAHATADKSGRQVLRPASFPESMRVCFFDRRTRPNGAQALLHRGPERVIDDAQLRYGLSNPGGLRRDKRLPMRGSFKYRRRFQTNCPI
jgi:hypothetical protein